MARGSLFRHVQPQIREEIGTGDQTEEFVVLHYDGHAAAIEHVEQIFDLCLGWKRLELVGHGGFDCVVKMRRIAMHFHEQIGMIPRARPF